MFTQDEKCCSWLRDFVLANTKQSKTKNEQQYDKLCVFDIGHNTGDFTDVAFSVFGENTFVHAFEPNPDIHYQHINNEMVKINRVAVSNKPGVLSLFIPTKLGEKKSNSHLASLYSRPVFAALPDAYVKTVDVPVVTIDSYCLENDISHVDYLKVDVEGYEIEVFQGAHKTLESKLVTAGQFEFGSTFSERQYTCDDVVSLLHTYGYSCFLGNVSEKNLLRPGFSTAEIARRSNDGWENILFLESSLLEF
jgi:FkbM family methyltransferase